MFACLNMSTDTQIKSYLTYFFIYSDKNGNYLIIMDKEMNVQILKQSENQGGLGGISINKTLSCKHEEQCLTPRIHVIKESYGGTHLYS